MTVADAHPGVESLVARCLLDPEFLRDATSNAAAALADRDLPPELLTELAELDLERVRQFAGFVTKVQNNHLWDPLPFTRALIKHYRIEIETFAAFHGRHVALRASCATRATRIAAFVEFLDERLAACGGHAGLRDMLRHERLRLELATVDHDAGAQATHAPVSPGEHPALVPVARSVIRVASFVYNPLEVAGIISRGELGYAELTASPVCLAYYAQPMSQKLRVIEIDELTAALLVRVDGHTAIGEIAASVAGEAPSRQLVAHVRPIFEALSDAGLIALRGAR